MSLKVCKNGYGVEKNLLLYRYSWVTDGREGMGTIGEVFGNDLQHPTRYRLRWCQPMGQS